jgi:hypothetical protein
MSAATNVRNFGIVQPAAWLVLWCSRFVLLRTCDMTGKGELAGHIIHLLSNDHNPDDAGYITGAPHATPSLGKGTLTAHCQMWRVNSCVL